MYRRDKPTGAPVDDLGLTGDPWMTGNLHDRPNPAERQAFADGYDQSIAVKLAHAGITPAHPAFDDLYQGTVNADLTHQVNGLEHGHELPMTKREAILYAPEEQWQGARAQGDTANALLAEYARREPELAQDFDGLSQAVNVTLEWYAERGERPLDNPSRFLNDVASRGPFPKWMSW